jgi:hypothetical protein
MKYVSVRLLVIISLGLFGQRAMAQGPIAPPGATYTAPLGLHISVPILSFYP